MNLEKQVMPIRILPSALSSQISSGEIIERPASVIKEIIENSIDAGSKNINILIEKHGLQSIILQDDGCGIHKRDLFLAVSHHATSKINSLSDLDTITTFGFRGEALASIRAISRLTLISRTQMNDVAWKIYSEGFVNHHLTCQPIAHPQGTTIIIENLFYNIPVRLKFIKNKKLEFLKIYEVVKKLALSHFHINFSLKHNNKLIIKYNSINNKKYKINRLKDVLNFFNIEQFLEIKQKKHNIFLFGWISNPYIFQEFKNIQYCYVNNRFIDNKIFISAVRSAYQKILEKKNISFILYLKLSSKIIDINIHPTKNEIKFHQPNLIYNFIYETILYNLKKFKQKRLFKNSLYQEKKLILDPFNSIFLTLISSFFFKKFFFYNSSNIKKKCNNFVPQNFLKKYKCSIGTLLVIVHNYYGLMNYDNNFSLISFPLAKGIIRKEKLKNYIKRKIIPECFISNIKITLTSEEYRILFYKKEILLKIGFHLIFKKNYVILSSIPIFLKKRNITLIIEKFFTFLFQKKNIFISEIINWLYINVFIELKKWTCVNGSTVLVELEYYCPLLLINPPLKLLQKVNINSAYVC